jgi:hypothetical protein
MFPPPLLWRASKGRFENPSRFYKTIANTGQWAGVGGAERGGLVARQMLAMGSLSQCQGS